MNKHPLERRFPAWHEACRQAALQLVDRVLSGGAVAAPPGLRAHWQACLLDALGEAEQGPGAGTPSTFGASTFGASTFGSSTSGGDPAPPLSLLSDTELDLDVQRQRLTQFIRNDAEWELRELDTRTMVWYRSAERAGFAGAMLLTPELISRTLCRALKACSQDTDAHSRLLRNATPLVLREVRHLYQGLADGLSGRRPAGGGPTTPPAGGPAQQVHHTTFLRQLDRLAGHGRAMGLLCEDIRALAEDDLRQDPALAGSPHSPLWRLGDLLEALARAAREEALLRLGRDLRSRLAQAPRPLDPRVFEQVESMVRQALSQAEQALPEAGPRGPALYAGTLRKQARASQLPGHLADFLTEEWLRVLQLADRRRFPPRRWLAVAELVCEIGSPLNPAPPNASELDLMAREIEAGLLASGLPPAAAAGRAAQLRSQVRDGVSAPAALLQRLLHRLGQRPGYQAVRRWWRQATPARGPQAKGLLRHER